METIQFIKEAEKIEQKLITFRRYLHQNAETGFTLTKTLSFVKKQLEKMGYRPKPCGKAGLVATINPKKQGKTFLLRADMDALPITEETSLPFSAKNGNMHACGHDMHTAMLLGAAYLLKKYEREINGRIKLLFQPAEEILEGAKDVIKHGVLSSPKVHAAAMIHVLTATLPPTNTVIVAAGGTSAPFADFFTIEIQGKGCHGSMPQDGVDALSVAAHVLIALQALTARELSITDGAILTIGAIQAGEAGNVIADRAVLKGSLRAFDKDTQQRLQKRIQTIASHVASAFRAKANVLFKSGTPALVNDSALSDFALRSLSAMLPNNVLSTKEWGEKGKSGGSEDFAYIAARVPSILLSIAAGNIKDGYVYPPHHPKTEFDERALPVGATAYAQLAVDWLRENS